MNDPVADLARIRFANALLLFDEFVQQIARHPDAATLRGLEGRFAERLGIQPSYWSQIKAGSRQIGERLARQFESRCRKPYGWMDRAQGGRAGGRALPPAAPLAPELPEDDRLPHNEDERFIVGLVLTYYRRHPERARARLLELLGEVLAPDPGGPPAPPVVRTDEDSELWRRSSSGVAPIKRKR